MQGGASGKITKAPPKLLPFEKSKGAMISKELQKVHWAALPSVGRLTCVLLLLVSYSTVPDAALGQEKATTKSATTQPAPDPCELLSSSEVERVQGEAVAEKKYSQQSGGGFLLRACFYRTTTFTKSVSLALAVPNPNSEVGGPREYFKKSFRDAGTSPDKSLADQRKPETKTEQDEPGTKPLEVSGLGEKAYWIPDPHVGTLYVLEGDYFLRISLGGTDADNVRAGKAKDLARAALRHLKSVGGNSSFRDPGHEHGKSDSLATKSVACDSEACPAS